MTSRRDGCAVVDTGGVRAELARLVLRQLPVVLAANALNSILVGLVMAPVIGAARAWGWTGTVILLTLGRALYWLKHRDPTRPGPADARAGPLVLGSALSGTLWGVGAAWMFPESTVHQMFLSFVVGGMAAGAVGTLGSLPAAFFAYTLPALLPLGGRFFLEDTSLYRAMAAMVIIFAAALTLTARNLYVSTRQRIDLQLRLAEGNARLAQANARLASEMDERLRTEEALRRSERMDAIGQLTGGIAHDFNNLLTAIIGSLERIAVAADASEKIRGLADTGLRAATHGAHLVDHLLAFSRQEPLAPAVANLNDLVTASAALCRQATGQGIEVRLALAEDAWPCRIDPVRFATALLNLVLNARDAMQGKGRLAITTSNATVDADDRSDTVPGDYVVLAVSDTGAGMPPEVAARAFEPFFTTKGVGKGSGLGLSMVYGFVQQSGGSVRIDSTPGAGTTVFLYLPRVPSLTASDVVPVGPASDDA
jgi:signal transduction histidine kinase